ncbi:hypothetical protein JNW90_21020 [Micromonospora sp. STR1s_5]|nr:hypothetical protein [Micromonospora sp. STR1s_5]
MPRPTQLDKEAMLKAPQSIEVSMGKGFSPLDPLQDPELGRAELRSWLGQDFGHRSAREVFASVSRHFGNELLTPMFELGRSTGLPPMRKLLTLTLTINTVALIGNMLLLG